MIILLGTATLGEGAHEAALDAFKAVVTASRAEEGVLHYSFAVDALDPSVLQITEKYADQDALKLHSKSAHFAAFQKAVAGIDMKIDELVMYNSDDGTKLM